MKKTRWIVMLALLGLAIGMAQAAAAPKLKFHGEFRFRGEYAENYADFDDDGDILGPCDYGCQDDAFDFFPYRVRLGLGYMFTDDLYAFAEFQYGDVFGNDMEQRDVLETNDDDADLYQAYVKMSNLGGTKFGVKLGRQEVVFDNELIFGDLDFYNGISHDGVMGVWDLERGPWNFFWFRPHDDNDDPGLDWDADLFGMHNTWDNLLENGTLNVYTSFLRYDIGNGAFNFDYDGDDQRVDLQTIGAQAGQTVHGEDGLNWSAELAFQFGAVTLFGEDSSFDDDEVDISANIFEGMIGYNWNRDGNDHRLFGTVYYSSGQEEDIEDGGDWETFIPLFQDYHRRNGVADVVTGTNLTSFSIGYEFEAEKQKVRVELFQFNATEDEVDNDQYSDSQAYVGGIMGVPGYLPTFSMLLSGDDYYYDRGAGNGFGSGSGSIGTCTDNDSDGSYECEDDLGMEIDVVYNYYMNEWVTWEAGLGWFMPGDAIENWTEWNDGEAHDDDVMRIYGQARLRF